MEMSLFGMPSRLNRNRRLYPTHTSYILAAHIRGRLPAEQIASTASGSADDSLAAKSDSKAEGNGNGQDEAKKTETAKSESTKTESKPAQESTGQTSAQGAEINVIVVADIDVLHREFFRLREEGDIPGAGIRFDFDNVTFVLNVIDRLAGEDRFLELRKRRPKHRTLVRIERVTEKRAAGKYRRSGAAYCGIREDRRGRRTKAAGASEKT